MCSFDVDIIFVLRHNSGVCFISGEVDDVIGGGDSGSVEVILFDLSGFSVVVVWVML